MDYQTYMDKYDAAAKIHIIIGTSATAVSRCLSAKLVNSVVSYLFLSVTSVKNHYKNDF